MNRVNIKKGTVGRSVTGGYEKVSALVGRFGVVGSGETKLSTGKHALLSSVNDMAAFGISENANKLLYHHITEYFRIGGKGVKLYVLNVAEGDKTFVSLINDEGVKKMISASDGQIFNLGFSFIPEASESAVDGLPSGTIPAIKAAQVLAEWTAATNRPLHIALECAGLENVTAATTLNLRDIKTDGVTVSCPQVSLVIGQDWDFAETLSDGEKKYAAVGTMLGCMAAQPVSYNIGEVATMMLTNSIRENWINAGLSSHEKVREKENQLESLNEKGYVFGEYYSGVVCFNDDHVCAPIVVDKDGNMNESSIALSRTNCKVIRELYAVYLPKIKSTVPLDSTTGKLTTGMVKYFEDIGNNVFANMTAKQELSGGNTEIDGDSNLLYGDKTLTVYFGWVPMGCVGRIDGTVNIKTSI